MGNHRDDDSRKVSPHRDAGMNDPEPSVSDGRRTGRKEPGTSEAFSEDEDDEARSGS
ncbi:MAG TPA: hypothetical protein VFS55_07120 [Dokdonella sp.]|nr:hypothetical protein [Dokdonella sp.]